MLHATFISIRTSTWEVTKSAGFFAFPELFQFTPLHERQHRFQYTPSLQKVFQFTPLHERRRANGFHHAILHSISIHASTWEATVLVETLPIVQSYFNSRLYMIGNALRPLFRLPPRQTFQFTPLHERQRYWFCYSSGQRTISIHASTWEATQVPNSIRLFIVYFNSRLYMRGNTCGVTSFTEMKVFQFTPLHERQLLSLPSSPFLRLISIHASTWEATISGSILTSPDRISIHASTWEATFIFFGNW